MHPNEENDEKTLYFMDGSPDSMLLHTSICRHRFSLALDILSEAFLEASDLSASEAGVGARCRLRLLGNMVSMEKGDGLDSVDPVAEVRLLRA